MYNLEIVQLLKFQNPAENLAFFGKSFSVEEIPNFGCASVVSKWV